MSPSPFADHRILVGAALACGSLMACTTLSHCAPPQGSPAQASTNAQIPDAASEASDGAADFWQGCRTNSGYPSQLFCKSYTLTLVQNGSAADAVNVVHSEYGGSVKTGWVAVASGLRGISYRTRYDDGSVGTGGVAVEIRDGRTPLVLLCHREYAEVDLAGCSRALAQALAADFPPPVPRQIAVEKKLASLAGIPFRLPPGCQVALPPSVESLNHDTAVDCGASSLSWQAGGERSFKAMMNHKSHSLRQRVSRLKGDITEGQCTGAVAGEPTKHCSWIRAKLRDDELRFLMTIAKVKGQETLVMCSWPLPDANEPNGPCRNIVEISSFGPAPPDAATQDE